jgi:hypothetical protein
MANIKQYLLVWAIVNICAGIWEVYAYYNRSQLKLETETLWTKISNGEINLSNFWMTAWSEYCKVDSRYIHKQYVWIFELLNAIISVIFLYALLNKFYVIVKLLLAISIFNCLLYFITLFIELFSSDKNNIIKQNVKKYAQYWMFIVYYLISGIWLIVPLWLYININLQ